MQNPTVAVTQCTDYSQAKLAEAISRQFELLGGLGKFVSRGDTVLLKPNFIAPKPRHCATQTDPSIIIEVARLLKDFGCKPFVADSPAWANVFACVKALELEEPLKKMGVPVKQLDNPKKCLIARKMVGISSIALDADVIINLPKFKSHQQLVATFAVKNMFGCVSGKYKAYWHFAKGKKEESFCKLLIEIYRFLNPTLTLIDGVIAMDGKGPINGHPRPLGWLIGGSDPIACETICAKLINLSPEYVPVIRTAKEMQFGCCDIQSIKTLGDDFSKNICTDFLPAQLIPIRFSLLHLCKSIVKQILLLTKAKKKQDK